MEMADAGGFVIVGNVGLGSGEKTGIVLGPDGLLVGANGTTGSKPNAGLTVTGSFVGLVVGIFVGLGAIGGQDDFQL